MATQTVHRQCNLCEAHCGITVEVDGAEGPRITGDPDDPTSKGYICPKAAALTDLYEDPDRLSKPIRRVGDEWVEMEWDEALDFAANGLARTCTERHGTDSLASYIGNPSAHTWSLLAVLPLRETMDTKNHSSATSTDQLPQHRTSAEMFGNLGLFPVPDIDRTDHLLVLGANPSVSNGSLMSAPGARHRLRDIVKRGGTVVVVDPRHTETAKSASEHVAIQPGGDAFLLLGMLHVIFAEGLARSPGSLHGLRRDRLPRRGLAARPRGAPGGSRGRDDRAPRARLRDGADGRRLRARRRLPAADGDSDPLADQRPERRHGQPRHARAASMFPEPFIDLTLALKLAGRGGPDGFGRYEQRVSGLPEMNGELPIVRPRRRDPDPGRGAGSRPPRLRRQPGHVGARRPAARRGARRSRVHGLGRPVRERDEPPRGRDPAPGLGPRAGRGGRGAATGGDPQPHPVQPGRGAEARGRQGGLGDPERPHAAPRAGNRDEGAGLLAGSEAGIAGAGGRVGDRGRALRDAPPRPDEGPHPAQGEALEARGRPRADEAAPSGRAAHARQACRAGPARAAAGDRRAGERSPPKRERARTRGLRPHPDRPPDPQLEQLLDAQLEAPHQGVGSLHRDAEPRGRGGPQPGGRREREGRLPRRRDRGPARR